MNRATRRESPYEQEDSFPLTPNTSSILGNFKLPGQGYTPPTPSLPNFSQSVGPGRATSPLSRKRRPSLPRPESPLRKPQLGVRPSMGGPPLAKTPSKHSSPAPGKFGQSVRGTQDSRDPSKKPGLGGLGGFTPRNGMKSSMGPRSVSSMGQGPINMSDEDHTPMPVSRQNTSGSISSVSSFNAKLRPASRVASRAGSRAGYDETDRLRMQLDDRDRQLRDQASSLAEMESSLSELQALMHGSENGSKGRRGSMEDKDAASLRQMLREKNEKIGMLTAEFDAHRADFRSTIDTLELASTETERVYEKKVEDLLAEVRDLQERTEDVDSVAQQLKQLEELVQELEEGLEDARRGEAEARGEVEFLRGEVERTRSELRREREKASAAINESANGESGSFSKEVEQRDDEIRGLKAIIHSLSRDAVPNTSNYDTDPEMTPRIGNGVSDENKRVEHELSELRAALEAKTSKEDELERELERLRRGNAIVQPNHRASALSTATVTQDRASSIRDSKGTIVSWRDREMRTSPEMHRRGNTLDTMPESDTYSSTNESYCELCETSGHNVLKCEKFGNPNWEQPSDDVVPHLRTGKDVVMAALSPEPSHEEYKPAPLSSTKRELPPTPPANNPPSLSTPGPVAGKESGVINMDKWCGVCEHDGHDSIDCPFEDFL